MSRRLNHWLMFFQEHDFEIFVKLGKAHVGPDHLFLMDNGESEGEGEGDPPIASLFKVQVALGYLEDV